MHGLRCIVNDQANRTSNAIAECMQVHLRKANADSFDPCSSEPSRAPRTTPRPIQAHPQVKLPTRNFLDSSPNNAGYLFV